MIRADDRIDETGHENPRVCAKQAVSLTCGIHLEDSHRLPEPGPEYVINRQRTACRKIIDPCKRSIPGQSIERLAQMVNVTLVEAGDRTRYAYGKREVRMT